MQLPARPESELEAPDSETDWLIAPDQDYDEQLGFYTERRPGKQAVRREITCEICGAAFTARRKDSTTCSPACLAKLHGRRRRATQKLERVPLPPRTRDGCGVAFAPNRKPARFCSPPCMRRSWRTEQRAAG